MAIKMIVAMNPQAIIGKDNKIPWFYKGDLKFFKDQTIGHVVIMGRKTWESLPPKMRPLPKRVNIVLSSKTPTEIGMSHIGSLPEDSSTWSMTAVNMEDALRAARDFAPDKDVWLIGGAAVYKEGLNLAEEIVTTNVPDKIEDVDGAVYWPGLTHEWSLAGTTPHPECPELTVMRWVRSKD